MHRVAWSTWGYSVVNFFSCLVSSNKQKPRTNWTGYECSTWQVVATSLTGKTYHFWRERRLDSLTKYTLLVHTNLKTRSLRNWKWLESECLLGIWGINISRLDLVSRIQATPSQIICDRSISSQWMFAIRWETKTWSSFNNAASSVRVLRARKSITRAWTSNVKQFFGLTCRSYLRTAVALKILMWWFFNYGWGYDHSILQDPSAAWHLIEPRPGPVSMSAKLKLKIEATRER